MNGKDTRIMNRREFLKQIPTYLTHGICSFKEGYSDSAFLGKETIDSKDDVGQEVKCAQIIPEYCLAWGGSSCQLCYLVCPLRDEAISMEDQKPRISFSLCNGCTKCLTACRTVNSTPAIQMVSTQEAGIRQGGDNDAVT